MGVDELGRTGPRQLQILLLLKEEGGVPYWNIIYEICGCKKSECKKDSNKNSCRVSVTAALRALKKKELVYKKRYLGEVRYYLTKKAKKILLDFESK